MGVTTYGYLSVGFSRALTDEELEAWVQKCEQGRGGYGPCCNSSHHGGELRVEVDPEDDHRTRLVCDEFSGKPAGYCYSSDERYNPDGWVFDDSSWGDVGIMRPAHEGFEVEAGGKVYDLEDGVRFFVECLPADVTASGAATFSSDDYRWVLAVDGRETTTDETVELRWSLWKALLDACESGSIITTETGKPEDGILVRLRDLVENGVLSD